MPKAECTRSDAASTPACVFIPKCQSLPFVEWSISGLRLPTLFLVDGEAVISVASTIVPSRMIKPFAAKCALIALNIFGVSLFFYRRRRNSNKVVASVEDSRLRSMPTKPRIALAVVDCIFDALIRQTKALLSDIHAQHARQPDWWPSSAFGLRIKRFDHPVQIAPGRSESISARKRSRRVSFFLAAYSRSEKLFCMMVDWSVVDVALLSQIMRPTGTGLGE